VKTLSRGCHLAFMLTIGFLSGAIHAQTTTTYSYDNAKRVSGTATASGSSVEYIYDANGNVISITPASNSSLALNQSADLLLAVPGQSETLTFVAGAGQSLILTVNSVSTVPSGPVNVAVYNANGALVSSGATASNEYLQLTNLAAGNYTVVITPQSGGTGSLQITLAQNQPSNNTTDTDGPIPLWAFVLLGMSLLIKGCTRQGRSAGHA
jgi:YD repeat-containing protein